MTSYLARLKARSAKKCLADELPKLSKPSQGGNEVGFDSFGSAHGGHFSRTTVAPRNFSDAGEYLAQVTAAVALMRKCLPDLVAAEVKGELVHRFAVVPDVMPRDQWLATRGNPNLLPSPSESGSQAKLTPQQQAVTVRCRQS